MCQLRGGALTEFEEVYRSNVGLVAAYFAPLPGAAGSRGSDAAIGRLAGYRALETIEVDELAAKIDAQREGRELVPGAWSGEYSGAYSGTFSLNWTQSGSKLSGKITLSDPPETTGITGSVSGGTIKFGTVSGAVYNGTVSGNSMSGSYQTPTGGGSWNASKAWRAHPARRVHLLPGDRVGALPTRVSVAADSGCGPSPATRLRGWRSRARRSSGP